MRRFAAVALAVVASQLAGAGQIVRPDTRLVHIDAVVADARGQAIRDLQAGDFEVIEDGQPRPIQSVRFVGTTAAPSAPTNPSLPILSRADELTEAARDDVRLFAVYLDEYHLTPGPALERTRAALTTFVGGLPPQDLLAVLRPLESLPDIRLNRDRARVREALAAFGGRKGDYEPRHAFEREFMAPDPGRIDTQRAQIAASAINALALHLGALKEGRKTLIVVSEGFDRRARRRGQDSLPTVDTIVRSANRGGVSIYTIDPRGFADTGGLGNLDADGAPERENLRMLAVETQGRPLLFGAERNFAFDRIASDAQGYYLIAFEPAAALGAGRFYPLQVRVTRPDSDVRARPAYWALPPRLAPPRPPDEVAAEGLPAITEPSPLVRTWFGVVPGANGRDEIQFMWEPSPRDPSDRGRAVAPSRVGLRVFAVDGTPDGTRIEPVAVEAHERRTARLALSPGAYRIQVVVRDAGSRLLGFEVRELFVAPATPGPAVGTPQVWRAGSARGAAENDPQALPVVGREFTPADRLLVRVPVHPPLASVTAQLTSERGDVVRPLSIGLGGSASMVYLDVPLAGLMPTAYRIEVAAADGSARASQTLVFRVIP